MFKSATVYLSNTGAVVARTLPQFVPCGDLDEISVGCEHPLLIECGQSWHLAVTIERKTVPADAVKREAAKMAAKITQETGRAVPKKQMKELREEARTRLLARAIPKRKVVPVCEFNGRVYIGSASAADCDPILSLLARQGYELTQLSLPKLTQELLRGLVLGDQRMVALDLSDSIKLQSEFRKASFEGVQYGDDPRVQSLVRDSYEITELGMLTGDGCVFRLRVSDGALLGLEPFSDEVFDAAETDDASRWIWANLLAETVGSLELEFGE